jgi:hypothetical protein
MFLITIALSFLFHHWSMMLSKFSTGRHHIQDAVVLLFICIHFTFMLMPSMVH